MKNNSWYKSNLAKMKCLFILIWKLNVASIVVQKTGLGFDQAHFTSFCSHKNLIF